MLEDAGVFKMNDEGIHAFIDFIENIEGGNKGWLKSLKD